MAALYIHIPFCIQKCAYCDFASYAGRESDRPRYLEALHREIAEAGEKHAPLAIQSVFIGGGTPSLLTSDQITRLFDCVRSSFILSPLAEISMEANPGALDLPMLRAARSAGVNRISLGAQAMQESHLRLLGRIHRWEDVCQGVRLAREAGFENISLDLMYGLPGQTLDDFKETLIEALSLPIIHISCYSLILEEGTPLERSAARGEVSLPDEEEILAMQHAATNMLRAAGYARYEISNYAKPGFECAHNIVYWTRGDYLGVGSAAHSLMNGERYQNPDSLDEYLRGIRRQEPHALSLEECREEAVMLQTRMTAGIDLAAHKTRYKEDFLDAHAGAIERLRRLGLIECTQTRLSLTEAGLDVHNAVVWELLR